MASSTELAVTAEFAGVVIAIRHGADEQVGAGTPLIVLEAMKMEHEVIASTDGVRKFVSAVFALRFVFTEMPSSVAPNAPPWPPPSATFAPVPLASATVPTRSNTLRIAPPTTSGS